CLQAYLSRTPADLAGMVADGVGVRLVKGAYNEPVEIAYAHKAEVDEAYATLARALLEARGGGSSVRVVFGTHDQRIIRGIEERAAAIGLGADGYEYHLLYGIQRAEQDRLAGLGRRVRVLISYGSYWFPWYMRRLAERPANLWFVAKSLVKA